MSDNQIDVKKRLMFIKNEDYYFVSYNIILLLNVFKLYNENKKFTDYRKLAFLIDFIADRNLISIIETYKTKSSISNKEDKYALSQAYTTGVIRIKQLSQLLFFLEKKGLIGLAKDKKKKVVNVWLNKELVPKKFFDKNLFQLEYDNILHLKQEIQRIPSLKLETLQAKLYHNYGIRSWEL